MVNEEKIISEINALKTANQELREMLNEIIKYIRDNNELYTTLMNGIENQSKELQVQTKRITEEETINDFYGDLSNRGVGEDRAIRYYLTPKVRAQHMELLNME